MDTKELTAILVVAMVGCVIVAGFVPIMNETVDPYDTFTNNGAWRMKEIENGDLWTKGDGVTWDYNGDNVTIPAGQNGSNILLGNDWCIRAIGHVRSNVTANANTNLNGATVTAGEELVIVSKTDATWTRNLNYPGYGADNNGEYILSLFQNDGMYVNGATNIYGSGISVVDNTQVFVHVEGTVNDGATFVISQATGNPAITDVVVSNATVNYTVVDSHRDLYKVTSLDCDVSFNTTIEGVDTTITGSISFSSVVVPYEVTAEKAIHADDNTASIISMLPFILIMGIVLMFVGVVIVRRYV